MKQVKSFKNKFQIELMQYDKRINVESIFFNLIPLLSRNQTLRRL